MQWLIVVLRVAQVAIAALLGLLVGEQVTDPGVQPGAAVFPALLALVARSVS